MTQRMNPLETESIGTLLRKFTIPSIVAMLVSSLYNIVDQFFIGQTVGALGNAATNIAFPLSTSCTAIALLFGIGGASAFNIAMGEKRKELAAHYMGTAISVLLTCGIALAVFTQLFLNPMLIFFGSPADVLPYASTYTRITSIGFPLLILQISGGHLLRADGRPKMTMICNLTGAVINTILDAIFVFGFHWGMTGAAAATVIGQAVAAFIAARGLMHCNSITLQLSDLRPKWEYCARVTSLGTAAFTNQIAMMIVQIIMNKSLKYYGSLSVYGESIPIAVVGIVMKVNMLFMSFVIGLSQGLQPIASFNTGAGKYDRVRKAYYCAISIGAGIAIAAFLIFQLFPRQIISIFGGGSELYYQFAISYFRVFLFFTFVDFMQPITSNFFTAIGEPKVGAFLSLTRQIIFFLPVTLILPLFMGIDGILYAGPVADFASAAITWFFVRRELKKDKYHSAK